MIISTSEFLEALVQKQPHQRLMGCDIGDKTIGVSLSDVTWLIASPLDLIKRKVFTKDLEKLDEALKRYEAFALIAGYPLNLNGEPGPQAQKVSYFCETAVRHLSVPIVLWDERMSTQAVTRIMMDADMSRQRRKEVVDKAAAAYILQGFLDFINRQKSKIR